MSRASWFPSSCSRVAAALCLAAALSGCGYRLAGTWTQPPAGIRTVFVRPAVNATVRQELDVPVTEAFRNRIEALGLAAASPSEADAHLAVRITSCADTPISWDLSQNVREYRLTITARLELMPAGKTEILRSAGNVSASEAYAAGATQEETNANRAQVLDAAATRLASDGIERLLTGF